MKFIIIDDNFPVLFPEDIDLKLGENIIITCEGTLELDDCGFQLLSDELIPDYVPEMIAKMLGFGNDEEEIEERTEDVKKSSYLN